MASYPLARAVLLAELLFLPGSVLSLALSYPHSLAARAYPEKAE